MAYYRKFEITDAEGKKIKFKVYPGDNNAIVVDKDEMRIQLSCRNKMNEMVIVASAFMDNNTIESVEIKEIRK